MKKPYVIQGRKRIIVVSLFSGMDMIRSFSAKADRSYICAVDHNPMVSAAHRANFKHPAGNLAVDTIRNINISVNQVKKNRRK